MIIILVIYIVTPAKICRFPYLKFRGVCVCTPVYIFIIILFIIFLYISSLFEPRTAVSCYPITFYTLDFKNIVIV